MTTDEAWNALANAEREIGRLREKANEFDAWLSSRGEFAEVLTAFRDAFGTDTSAAALSPEQGDENG